MPDPSESDGRTGSRTRAHGQAHHGRTLAVCAADKTVRLFAKMGGHWRCFAVLEEGHQRTIRWCSWSPCGLQLASCSFDGLAMIWRCETDEFECVASLEGHENEVKAVAWSASGSFIATCGRDKSVFVWEAEDDQFDVAAVIHSHTQDVKAVVWHPISDVLASASYDDTIKLYSQDGDDWRCATTLSGHASTVWCVAFSADGKRLVSCSDDRSVILWEDKAGDLNFQQAAKLEQVHDRPIYTIDWQKTSGGGDATGEEDFIATGGGDDAVCLLRASISADPSKPKLELHSRCAKAHDGDVNTVAWSSCTDDEFRLLATGGDDGQVKLWKCR
uniref:Probable cytosolic iron-sulfur protein assembly protein CIAO1 homolog n=1 Tax=Chrysotila carterae TaxID=13221 RepID=A0A7S4EYS8_CHRCT